MLIKTKHMQHFKIEKIDFDKKSCFKNKNQVNLQQTKFQIQIPKQT